MTQLTFVSKADPNNVLTAEAGSELAKVLSTDSDWEGTDGREPKVDSRPRRRKAPKAADLDEQAAKIASDLTPDGEEARTRDAAAAKLGVVPGEEPELEPESEEEDEAPAKAAPTKAASAATK